MQALSRLELGFLKKSIVPVSVGCYCVLLMVELVFRDRIRVEFLLNTFKLPFKMANDCNNMSMYFTWMQTGPGDRARKANRR